MRFGPTKSLVLPVFHAFTGCDTVSQFAQVGKKTAWKVWQTHDELTGSFYELHSAPEQFSEETEASLEYFTILLYDNTAICTSINEVRCQHFLPPRLPYRNISEGQHYKVGTIKDILLCHIASCPPLLSGDGLAQNSGGPCGQTYWNQVHPAQSY